MGLLGAFLTDFHTTFLQDAKQNVKTFISDNDGRVAQVVTETSDLQRSYGPFGRVLSVTYPTTPGGISGFKTISNGYDQRERLITSSDLALSRTYNAFDEVLQERRGDVVTDFTYDKASRVHEVNGTNSDGSQDFSEFSYDEGAYGLGKLTGAISGPSSSVHPWEQEPVASYSTLTYDAFGRLQHKSTSIADNDEEDDIDITYGVTGEIGTVLYPQHGPPGARFGVTYQYDGLGNLLNVHNSSNAADIYWQVNHRTPDGLVATETYGNSIGRTHTYDPDTRRLTDINATHSGALIQKNHYDYDPNGSVRSRSDTVAGIEDVFQYDSDDRLHQWTSTGNRSVDRTYDYYADGSFKSITNDYLTDGSLTTTRNFTYLSSGPFYADNPSAVYRDGENEYSYDRLGRQVTRKLIGASAASRTITYTSFDLPSRIDAGGIVAAYSYDAFHQRTVKQSSTSTTRYFDNLYEKRTDVSGGELNVYHIMGESGQVAQVTRAAEDGSAPLSATYLQDDSLGSVSVVTSASGQVLERLDYEPFGRRISPQGVPSSASASEVRVGFTGQEHDDEYGLISMKGRIYDPALRSFVSHDPIIASPLNILTQNPYLYVRGNPLKYTDPTGFDPVGHEGCDCDLEIDVKGKRIHDVTSVNFITGSADGTNDLSFSSRPSPNDGAEGTSSTGLPPLIENARKFGTLQDIARGTGAALLKLALQNQKERESYREFLSPEALESLDRAPPTDLGLLGAIVPVGADPEAAPDVALDELIENDAINNPIPKTVVRVIPNDIAPATLGRPGEADVFVTAAEDIVGLDASQIADKLGIAPSEAYKIYEFLTPTEGLASPVSRLNGEFNSAFVGNGLTSGGAREFIIPNGPIPSGAQLTVVR